MFFDEIQRVDEWQDAVNAFRVEFDCDIYITGSNAHLLSGEYATYLAGRSVEIKMLQIYEPQELLEAYIRFGGVPGIADVELNTDRALTLLDGAYSMVVVRDILERERRR